MRLGKSTPAKHSYLGQVFKFTQKPITGSIKKKKNNMIPMLGDGIGGVEREREKQRQKHRDTQREKDTEL